MTHTLLKRARQHGTPLIKGNRATFVWQGAHAPHLVGDFDDWELENAPLFSPIEPNLWSCTLTLPRDTYMEYALDIGGGRITDPLNERTTPDGLGHVNSFFYMSDAGPTELARSQRGVPRGSLTRHDLPTDSLVVGSLRTVYLYQPPTPDPCPLLVVFDGSDYVRRARLPVIVDNLIAQRRIRPIALALVANGRTARTIEYACSETTLDFMLEHVLPLARETLSLVDERVTAGVHGVLGASMGGLMALYAAIRMPTIFGHVLSQSGAFALGPHELVIWDLIRQGPVQPIETWMDVGHFEWLLHANRQMHELLVSRGYDVSYREYNAGHNYPAWRDDVWRGIETLFPA